jgi:hypothetical protein
MDSDIEISSEELIECARVASQKAIESAKTNGVPYTVQEGRNIVKHSPDGTTTVLDTLPKAYVRPKTKYYRIC